MRSIRADDTVLRGLDREGCQLRATAGAGRSLSRHGAHSFFRVSRATACDRRLPRIRCRVADVWHHQRAGRLGGRRGGDWPVRDRRVPRNGLLATAGRGLRTCGRRDSVRVRRVRRWRDVTEARPLARPRAYRPRWWTTSGRHDLWRAAFWQWPGPGAVNARLFTVGPGTPRAAVPETHPEAP